MKLVPVDEKLLGGYRTTSNKQLIDDFIESGMKCAEVEGFTQQDAKSCASSLYQTIKRYRVFNVKAIMRKDRVFLIREEL